MSNSGSNLATTLYNLTKELWVEIDRGQQVLLGSIVALAFVCLAYGWGTSGNFTMPALQFGFILIIYSLFHIAFYYAARFLPEGSAFIRYGLLMGGVGVFIGAVLYSRCILVASTSNCIFAPDPIRIFERFGRFFFFAYPLIVGISLVYCSIRYLQSAEGKSEIDLSENQSSKLSRPVAILVIILVLIEVVLIALISSNVIGLQLATPGPSLGDIDPVTHMAMTIVLGISGLILCFALERRWKRWSDLSERLYFIQPVSILLYSGLVVQQYGRPNNFFSEGTGLGVLVTVCLIVFSFVVLTSQAIRTDAK